MKGFKSTSTNPYTYTQSGVWKKGQYTFQAIVLSNSGYAFAFQGSDTTWQTIDLSWQIKEGSYSKIQWTFTLEVDAVAFRLIANTVTGETIVLQPMLENGSNGSTPIAHEEDLRGVDGDFHEFIFTRNDTGIAPPTPLSTQENDLEPIGWTDNPQGVTKELPFEFVSMREKKNRVWLDFSPPSLWAKWAADGLSVNLSVEGHYRSHWEGTTKVTEIVGGVVIGGNEVVKVSAVFREGEKNVAATVSESKGFQWYVNGVHLIAFDNQPFITLDETYGDGFADYVVLSYLVNSLREEERRDIINISEGMDGIGEEFIFKTNNSNTEPPILPQTTDVGYQDDDHHGDWSDDPVAPTESNQFVWAAKRKKVGGIWEAFGTPSVWTRWVMDGGDAAYWELHSSTPLIYKDSEDASTSGEHTTIVLSGRYVKGASSQNGGYISVQPKGGVEDTPLISPREFTPPNNAGVDEYVIRLYDDAPKTTLLDTLTVPIAFKGERGISAISIILSNEADALPASTEGVVTDYTGSGTTIRVFEGTTELTYGTGNGKYQVSATGSNISPNSTPTTIGNARVYGNASNMGEAATAAITFTVSGKTFDGESFSFDKVQNFTKSERGNTGASAPLLYLSTSTQVMRCNPDNTPQTGQTISFEAKLQNVSGTATFVATPYNASGTALTAITLGGSGNTRTLTNAQWSATYKRIEVVATLGSLTDKITIHRLNDGADGETVIIGFLTNENITLQATSAGVVSSFATANGEFWVYEGLTKITSGITFSKVSQTGCTAEITYAGVYSVSAMSADNATAVFRAVYDGVTIDRVLTLSKSNAGEDGITIVPSQQGYTYRADLTGDIIGSIANGMVELTIISGLTPITCPSATSGGTPTTNGTYMVTRTLGSGITTSESISGGKYRITPTTLDVDEASVNLEIKIMMGGVVISYPLILTFRKQFDGADGKSTEFIFKGHTSDTTAPALPITSQQDDWYGQGTANEWSDDSVEPTKTIPYVWASQRKKADGVWGAFTPPRVWLRYVEDGKDSYTVLLSNGSHTFVGGETAALAGSTSTQVLVYRGIERVFPTSITVNTSDLPVGMTRSITLATSTVTFNVTTAMTSGSGTIPITFVVNGISMTTVFSYAVSFKGSGWEGSAIIRLAGGTQFISVSKEGIVIPSSNFTVVGTAENTSISSWSYTVNSNSPSPTPPTGVSRSGDVVTINPNTSTFKLLTIIASDGAVSDSFSIARVTDGGDGDGGYSVSLSKTEHTFNYNKYGNLKGLLSDGVVSVEVMKGANALICDSLGVLSPTVNNTYRVTSITQSPTSSFSYNVDRPNSVFRLIPVDIVAEEVEITFTIVARSNDVDTTFTRKIRYQKHRDGADGNPGDPGEEGDSVVHIYKQYPTQPATPSSGVLNPTGWSRNPDYSLSIVSQTNWTFNGKWYQSEELTAVGNSSTSRITFTTYKAAQTITLELWANGAASYDYVYAGKLDTAVSTSNYYNRVLNGKIIITYDVPTAGSHYIDIFWRKGIATIVGSNRGYYAIISDVKVWRSVTSVIGGVVQDWSEPKQFLIDSALEERIYCLSKTTTAPAISDSDAHINDYIPLPCSLLMYRGDFTTNRAYSIGQVVIYQFEYYKVIKAISSASTRYPTDEEYFEKISAWVDNPVGANKDYLFEFVAIRKKQSDGLWGPFVPSVWSTWGASGHSPYIDETTKTWWTWDEELEIYTDTGVKPIGSEGRIPYPAGYWEAKVYTRDDNYAPYVQHTTAVYLLVEDSASKLDVPGTSNKWKALNHWQAIFVDSLVAKFAQIGGAVFTGDTTQTASGIRGRLISEMGVNGTTNFKSYTGDSGAWQPNLMLDFKTGRSVFNNTFVRGVIDAVSGSIGNILIEDSKIFSIDKRIEIDGENSSVVLRDSSMEVKTIIHPRVLPSVSAYFDTGSVYSTDLSSLNTTNLTGTVSKSLVVGGSSSDTFELFINGFIIEARATLSASADDGAMVEASTYARLTKNGQVFLVLGTATAIGYSDSPAIDAVQVASRSITVSGGATYTLIITHDALKQEDPYATTFGKVSGLGTMTTGKTVNRSEIGVNGMVIATSPQNYTYMVDSDFQVRRGSVGFKVTPTGVYKSTNMSATSPTWTLI